MAVVMVAALLAVTGGGVCLGTAVIARHRAQSGADLAALAAAARLPAGVAEGCAEAAALAHRMRINEIDCVADGLDIVVTVQVPVTFAGRWVGSARAVARAGPGG
ncbi:MAG: Rv3654c family TadE-like protein [Mycobacterium sp.]